MKSQQTANAPTPSKACACHGHAHHQHASHGPGQNGRSSWLSSILPVLACAVCPTCVGVWAQALPALGIGLVVTETQHHLLLALAIAVALGISIVRFVRTHLIGPFALSLIACATLTLSHVGTENHLLSWLSIAALLVASVWQQRAQSTAHHKEQLASHLPKKEYSP